MATVTDLIEEANLASAIEAQEFNLLRVLNPLISIDGNKWCILWGENLQDGVAGFGDSPILAVYDFSAAWRRVLPAQAARPRQLAPLA